MKTTFKEYLKQKGKAEHTINQYENTIKRLPLPINAENITTFLSSSPTDSRTNYISAIKAYLKYKKEFELFMLLEDGGENQ